MKHNWGYIFDNTCYSWVILVRIYYAAVVTMCSFDPVLQYVSSRICYENILHIVRRNDQKHLTDLR